MNSPSKVVIIVLIAALIIISTFFAIEMASNLNPEISNSKDLALINVKDKDNFIQSFDSPQIKADILIPSKRNDDTIIENEKFDEIRTELATQFGGVTKLPYFNGTSIRNETRYDGTNNSGFYVVVPNTSENLEWLVNYKQTLKDRLHQDRIFMTFSPIMIVP